MLLCRLWVFSYVFLLWIIGSSCHREPSKPQTNIKDTGMSIPPIEGYIVKPTALRQEIQLTGTISPAESTELRPETSGKVVSLHLPEGKLVAKGTLLVKLKTMPSYKLNFKRSSHNRLLQKFKSNAFPSCSKFKLSVGRSTKPSNYNYQVLMLILP